MEIKITEAELQFLAAKYSDTQIRFSLTGLDEFSIFHPKADVRCKILGHSERSITISYDMGFWKNLFVRWFVKLEKEGIRLDKKQKQVDLNPFIFLPDQEQAATKEFKIEEVSIQTGMLIIRLGIIPKT
jgi:hypothetical protein